MLMCNPKSLFAVVIFGLLSGCGQHISPEGEALLLKAENDRLTESERLEAMQELGRRKENATLPRIQRMLHPDLSYAHARQIFLVMGDMPDESSLPYIDSYLGGLNETPPDKLNTLINATARKCSRDR